MTVPPGLHGISIGRNEYVLACGPQNPLAAESRRAPIGNDRVLAEPFADVCFRTAPGAPYETLRDVAFPAWSGALSSLRTTHFLSAVTTLSQSRLVMVLPKKTAETLAQADMAAIIATEEKSIVQETRLIWHHRTDQDLGMQWVHSVLLACTKEDYER